VLERYLGYLNEKFASTDAIEELGVVCGRDFAPVQATVEAVLDMAYKLVKAAVDIIELVDCESINPIYTHLFYQGTCDYSVKAMTWVLAASVVLSVTGLTMIMLRSSYKRTVYVVEQSSVEPSKAGERAIDDENADTEEIGVEESKATDSGHSLPLNVRARVLYVGDLS
jgi:hypothetical protein